MGQIQLLSLMPVRIERGKAAHKLGPDEARVLENMDVTFQPGILRRGPGMSKTRVGKSNTTVTNCGTLTRRDGRRLVWDYSTGGDWRVTTPDGLQGCPSSLVNIEDGDDFDTTTFTENFDDDLSVFHKYHKFHDCG